MWRNYLDVGVRALAKNKTYAFINIFGLAIGLAACLMLLALRPLRDELRRAGCPMRRTPTSSRPTITNRQTGEEGHLQMTSYVAGPAAQGRFPADRAHGLRLVGRAGHHRAAAKRCRPRTCCWSTISSSTCCNSRSSQGDPATALAAAQQRRADPERGAAHLRHARMSSAGP